MYTHADRVLDMKIYIRWAVLAMAVLQAGCSQGKQAWICQSMLNSSTLDYSTMRMERDLRAVAFSVLIRDDQIQIDGYLQQGWLNINKTCKNLTDDSTYACRDSDKINIGNIGNQEFHSFTLNVETGIFSYANIKRFQSTQGVCSRQD
jgi:hypothetical protein